MPTGPYTAYTQDPDEPRLLTFTGPGVRPFTAAGSVAQEAAAGLPPPVMPPPANVSAPLAMNPPAMTPVGPTASVADVQPDMAPPPQPAMGPNGIPGASFTPPVRADALDNPLNAPPEPVASMAPKEELVSKRPEASFAGDRPAPTPSRRIGPGGAGGSAPAGPVDASGGWGSVANQLGLQKLMGGGGGSAGTRADAWQNQTRTTGVQDGRVGPGVLGASFAATQQTGEAADQARQAGDAFDANRIAVEAKIEENIRERAAEREAEAAREKADIRSSMRALIDESDGPDINPGEWWGEQSIGSTILLALSAGALGAINGRAGVKGNAVIEGIDQSIERNIMAQVKNKDAKATAKAARFARLGQAHELARADGADDLTALATAKVVGWSIAQKQLQVEALADDSPQARAKLAVANAAIDQRKADILMADAQRLQTTRQGNERFIPKGTGAGGGVDKLKLAREMALFNKEFNPQGKAGEAGRGTAAYGDVRFELDPRLGDAEAATVRRVGVAIDQGMKAVDDVIARRGTGVSTLDADVLHGIDRMAYSDALITGQGQATKDQVDGAREKWRGIVAEKGLKYARETFENDANLYKKQYERR